MLDVMQMLWTSRPSFGRGPRTFAAVLLLAIASACSAAPPIASPSPPPAPSTAPSLLPGPSAPPSVASPAPEPTNVPLPTTATGWARVPKQPSVSGVQFLRVVWTGTRFVATATALDTNGGVFLDSRDGLTWNRQSTESADEMPLAVAAGPHGVVAIGSTDDHVTAWVSPDGLTWTVRHDAFPAPNRDGDQAGTTRFTVQGVVATDDGWLAVGREDPVCQLDCGTAPLRALVWTSSDGLTWISVPDAAGFAGRGMDAVARTADGYVAVGLGKARAAAWTSPDGTTWTPVVDKPVFHGRPGTDPGFWVEMTGVAVHEGVIVAAGMEGPQGGGENTVRAWWSIDGRTWSDATGERFRNGQVFGVASTPAGFIATGPSGVESCLGGVWESADGRAWSCAASDPSFTGFGPYAAAASPSVVVAVGLDSSGPESDQGWPGGVWRKALP